MSFQKLTLFLITICYSLCACGDDVAFDKGQQVYIQKCASCHGSEGQGAKGHFEDPLYGDLAFNELSDLISETMPEDDPGSCKGEEAEAVARFIFHEFYSPEAQLRRQKPRIQLSRRTARQFRESVADLIASFENPRVIPVERGISGRYFASSNQDKRRSLARQLDPNIDFGDGVEHFRADGKYEGVQEIKKQNKMGDGFSVYWNGGLVTPESGEYEFIVECRNGFKLYVNDATKPLIDQWVRSNDDLTHRQKVHLLGGRIYTLNLSLFQFEEKEVRIRLEWVTPSGIREAIPPEAFVPFGLREGLVISEPFPADDASDGYERGISVSEQWDSATTAAAIEAANWIASRIWKLARTKESADDRTEKVREFCVALVERAFVSPLSEEDKQFFVWQHFENELSIYDQVKRVVILALKSPRFLYPTLQQREPGYELAARTALALVDSVPDKLLLSKAAKGQLTNDDELSQQLDRMIEDPRSKQKLREFFHYWLKTEEATDATKDNEAFPDFDEHLIRDLQRSLDFYLDHVVWNDSSDFRNLFLADYLFVNQRIARFYNMEFGEPTNSGGSKADPEDGQESAYSGFKKIKVDPEHRSGILTHPFLMSGLAYHKDSSPIHRGVFVARRLLGRQLRQPPDDVKPLTEEFDLTMTTRQRVAYQTREKACMNCHSVINPLGFSLENFDAVGRFRTEEKQKPIDVTTVYKSRSGEEVKLSGARDLANYLVTNETAQKSFIAQLFRHYAKQPIHAYGEQILSDLHHKFVEHEFNIRILIREIVWVIVKHGYDEEVPDQSVSE